MSVTWDRIKGAQAYPARLRPLLGGLAPWLLAPEARAEAPFVEPCPGLALVLCVWDEARAKEAPGLARGFALPLQWVARVEHDPTLPAGLSAVADAVRAAVKMPGYGLRWAEFVRGVPDLSGLGLEGSFGSAWASLAASLLVLKEGGAVRPQVLATGEWAGEYFKAVGGAREKLAAVRALGLTGAVTVFLPAGNEADTHQEGAEGALRLRYYKPGQATLEEALGEHLVELEAPPGAGSPLEVHLGYVNRRPTDAGYVRHYLTHVVEGLGAQIRAALPAGLEARRVVLPVGVGSGVTLPVLWMEALRAPAVTLLGTPESRAALTRAYGERLEALGEQIRWEELARNPSPAEIKASLGRLVEFLLGEGDPGGRAVDVTGGTAIMSMVLTQVALKAGARLLYMQHQYNHSRVIVGQERCLLLNDPEEGR
jgi:hypothetical protein